MRFLSVLRLTYSLLIAITALLSGCSDPPASRLQTTERDGVLSIALDQDGAFALVGTLNHGTSVWRLQEQSRLFEWGHDADLNTNSLAVASTFSRDTRFALTAERTSVVMWNMSTGRPTGFWSTEGDIRSLALSDGGRHVLLGLSTREAVLIDTTGRTLPAFIAHAGGVNAVAISRDGRLGATGADDGMVRLWNLAEGTALFSWKFDAAVASLVFSDDDSLLFAAPYHGKGRVMQVAGGQLLSEIGSPRGSLTSARFAPDNASLLTGSPSGALEIWSVRDGIRLQSWQVPRETRAYPTAATLTAVSFGTGQNSVVAALSNGAVMTWPLR